MDNDTMNETATMAMIENDIGEAPKAEESTSKPKKFLKKGGSESGTVVAIKEPAKTGTVIAAGTDLILDTAHEVENISKPETAVSMVLEAINSAQFNEFKLGGLLAKIHTNNWYDGQKNFKDFIEKKLQFPYRKAMYLIEIYTNLVNSGVKWEQVKSMGWTKLKEISHLVTQENVDGWVEKAASMTVVQLTDYLKNSKAIEDKSGDPDAAVGDSKAISTVTFKTHSDQREIIDAAITKSKELNGTDVATVALEHICTAFIEGTTGKVKTAPAEPAEYTVEEALKRYGPLKFLEAISEMYPDIEIEANVPEQYGEASAA